MTSNARDVVFQIPDGINDIGTRGQEIRRVLLEEEIPPDLLIFYEIVR
jgi:hypothetical protein